MTEKRFGKGSSLLPLPTILDVCPHVAKNPSSRGVVPIKNSSGGAIHETVEILLEKRPRIHVEEELTLRVNLALITREACADC